VRWRGLVAPLLVAALALGTTGCGSQVPTGAVNLPSGFDLQAHRGGRDARPENTLPAFAYALSVGVTTLEMDIVISEDGVPMVSHNAKLRTYLAKNSWGKYVTSD